jgi:DNA polymerase III delta prime subunit
MHLLDLTKQAPVLYESGTSLCLEGPPGVGKTDTLRNEIRAILSAHYGEEFGYHDFQVPSVDAPDIRGFLVPTKDKEGHATSFFTRSPVLPSREYLAKYKRGILVMDERNGADMIMLKALTNPVLYGRFGEEYLPGWGPQGRTGEPYWWVVSTTNSTADRSGVIKAPRHLENRERKIKVDPNVTAWALWAEAKGIHPMIVAFAKHKPGVVFSPEVPKAEGQFCTPRSYVSAAKLLALAAGKDSKGEPNMAIPNTAVIMQMVAGDIGDAACAELFGFLKVVDELPTIEEILKDPAGCKAPKELSAAYAASQMCVHFASPQNIDKLWTYAERMPKELQVSTAKSLLERGGGILLNSQALNKWIMANKTLIHASNAK